MASLEGFDLVPSLPLFQVIVLTWDDENNEDFLWDVNGCAQCDTELEWGATGYVWGEPLGEGKYVVLHTYCSEECVGQAVDLFACKDKQTVEYYTSFHQL